MLLYQVLKGTFSLSLRCLSYESLAYVGLQAYLNRRLPHENIQYDLADPNQFMISQSKLLLNPDWTLFISITQVIAPFSGKEDAS